MNSDIIMTDNDIIVINDDNDIIIIDDDDNDKPSKRKIVKKKISPKKKIIAKKSKKNIKKNNASNGKKTIKKYIPATVKRLVWNKWIGEEIGKSKCLCCKVTYITQLSFHTGHIISEFNGGKICVSNLKPICQNCNSSMGTKNMNEFIKSLK